MDDVIAADHDLERAKARAAAAKVAIERAGRALFAELQSCWHVVIPYLAANRAKRPAGLDVLRQSLLWPALRDPVGVATRTTITTFHWRLWWPLEWEDTRGAQ